MGYFLLFLYWIRFEIDKMVCVPILAFNRFKGELIEISDIIKYCPSYMQKDFMSIMLKIT